MAIKKTKPIKKTIKTKRINAISAPVANDIAPSGILEVKDGEQMENGELLGLKPDKNGRVQIHRGGRPLTVALSEGRITEAEEVARREKIKEQVSQAINKNINDQSKELAKVANIPATYATALLTEKRAIVDWKVVKRHALDIQGVGVLGKLLRTIDEGRVSPYQAGMLYSMLHDKIYRVKKEATASNVINVGDNRKVSVFYPNFTPKDKKTEYNTTATTPEIDE